MAKQGERGMATDPPVSEAQRRAMWAAKAGHSTSGIPQSVGKEFANADPGGKLPERAKDLEPEKFGVIKQALGFLRDFFSEEEREEEHVAEDDEPPKGRAASVAFVCPDGRTLFVKRAADENDPHGGKWCWPGGQCEDGEAFEDAAKREASEEAGEDCTFDGIRELHKARTPMGWDHVTYVVPVKEPFEPTLSDECEDHAWAHPDEAPAPLHPGVKATLDEVLRVEPEDPTPAKPRVKPVVATRDAAAPSGKLSETTRTEIGSEKHREDMPESAFLVPSERKYPVKEERDGTWHYTRNLLLAAARRARLQGRTDLARRADAIRVREFSGGEGGEDAFNESDHPRGEAGKFTAHAVGQHAHPVTGKLDTPTKWEIKHNDTPVGIVNKFSRRLPGGVVRSSRGGTTFGKGAWVHEYHGHHTLSDKRLGPHGSLKEAIGAMAAMHRQHVGGGGEDTELAPAEGGWMRQVINAGSEMPAMVKSQRITAGQLRRAPVTNVAGKDDWSPEARAAAAEARKRNAALAKHHKGEADKHYAEMQAHQKTGNIAAERDARNRYREHNNLQRHHEIKAREELVPTGTGRSIGVSKVKPLTAAILQGHSRRAEDSQPTDWSRFRARSKTERAQLAMDRALPSLRLARSEGMAFDRETRRRYDSDNRLHVDESNLTKAQVAPYWGWEIPGWEDLGLDKDRKYHLLRPEEELKKAVDSANGLPLLDKHQPATAEDHPKELVVGATGTNARWDPPYIKNSLSIWPEYASRAVEDGSQRELSMGYAYKPVMEPGVYKGVPYDGKMTAIKFNHAALVQEGRSGVDVAVADAMPPQFSSVRRRGAYLR